MSEQNNNGRRMMKNTKLLGRLAMLGLAAAVGLGSTGCAAGSGAEALGNVCTVVDKGLRSVNGDRPTIFTLISEVDKAFKEMEAEQWRRACAQGIPRQMLDEMTVEAASEIGTEFPNLLEADTSIQSQVVLAVSPIEVTDPSLGNSAQMSYRKIVGLLRKNPRMAGLVQIHEGTYREARQQMDQQLGFAAPRQNPLGRGPDMSGPVRVDESLVYQLKATFTQADENMDNRENARRKFLVEVQVLHLDAGMSSVASYSYERSFRWDSKSKAWVKDNDTKI